MQAVVQIRGEVDTPDAVVDTLAMLNIHAVNHATFIPERDTYQGMLTKVNDYVAFGEPSVGTVATLLERRAEPEAGDADIDDEWVADHTSYDDVHALAEALVAEETTLQETPLAPVVRLHAPRGGHDGIKQAATDGGQLGRHTTEEIDSLLEAMR
jgi:large subunit ribosomal protein L30